jgi:hypothetical protein
LYWDGGSGFVIVVDTWFRSLVAFIYGGGGLIACLFVVVELMASCALS